MPKGNWGMIPHVGIRNTYDQTGASLPGITYHGGDWGPECCDKFKGEIPNHEDITDHMMRSTLTELSLLEGRHEFQRSSPSYWHTVENPDCYIAEIFLKELIKKGLIIKPS